jgi:hypothetical protein
MKERIKQGKNKSLNNNNKKKGTKPKPQVPIYIKEWTLTIGGSLLAQCPSLINSKERIFLFLFCSSLWYIVKSLE